MDQQVGCSAVLREKCRRTAPRIIFGLISLVFITILSFHSFSPAFAQAVFGSIFGTATDSTGAVVPNATVTVTDVSKGTSQQVQTNESGNYIVTRLIPDCR